MDAAAKNPSLSLRDTAMFAVAASLGLRAGDIVRLTLSDIDWIHHEIRFVQNKTGVELHLPLEASVGNAIANYILHERPKTQSPALFVRSRIPFDFMTSTAAGDRLRKYMKLSDVDYTPGDGKGFHSFRRYVASSMINQEVPIDIVKEILGHPRLYDLRHTFATHRLYQWVKEGKDINACLAYLSEYMGHSNLESTAYYIHLLPTLYTDLPELHLDSSFEMEADLCD